MRSARAEAPLQRLRAQIRRSRPRGCCYCLKGTLKYGEGRPIRTSVRATFLSSWLVASLAAISLSACDSTPDDSVLVRPEATFTIEKTGVGKTEFDATCVETRPGSGRWNCAVNKPRRFRCKGLTTEQADQLDGAGCPAKRSR